VRASLRCGIGGRGKVKWARGSAMGRGTGLVMGVFAEKCSVLEIQSARTMTRDGGCPFPEVDGVDLSTSRF
jgi:hypothetical protein